MKNLFVILCIITVGFFSYKYYYKYPYRYVGYFYPSINDMEAWVESDPLPSLDACHNWIDEMTDFYFDRDKNFDINNFDYECGKDCYKGDPYQQGVTYTCHTSVD